MSLASAPVLDLAGLTVTYPGPPPVRAVDDLDLRLAPGRCLGVLGESGSGKTSLAKALLGLLPEARVEGRLRLAGRDLAGLDEAGWQAVRWRRLALVPQSTASLHPALSIGAQIAEPLRVHEGLARGEASARAAAALEDVGLGAAALERTPEELSGGQRRLALLAMALVLDPEVVVLDEPTAGLDLLSRARVLALLGRIRAAGTALLLITHDLDALRGLADDVAVLYRGWLAERGPAARVLDDPRAPFTWGLANAVPTLGDVKDLRGIRGAPPEPGEVVQGCPFLERCTQAVAACEQRRPPLVAPEGEDGARLVACARGGRVPVLRARGLAKAYRPRRGGRRRGEVAAVDDVSLEVGEGEAVGLVGPTGAGKSTLGQLLVRLVEPDAGSVELEGRDLLAARGADLAALRRRAQLLFQDPYEALSPRLSVAEAVREPLDVAGVGTPAERDAEVAGVLAEVRLPSSPAFAERRAHELSGGQLQRVALARALVLRPKLLVADESVAMLDPSEQTKLLALLRDLQVERGMAMVVVSHDLAVVLRVADRVVVLDEGRIVEEATGAELLAAPQHPLTAELLAAAGRPGALLGERSLARQAR